MISNIKNILNKYWFIGLFFIFCCYPVYGVMFEGTDELSGMVATEEEIVCNVDSIMDGSYQTYCNNYVDNHFYGRKMLIHIRNQILYTVCKKSPNENVVIGKEGYLYEPLYINRELQIYAPASEEYFAQLGDKLELLQEQLNNNGKELYIFITPSKAHICKEEIPLGFQLLSNEQNYETTEHKELVNMLEERGLYFFDSVEYIEQNLDKFEAPVFYKSGIHWSYVWGESATAEFLNYINEKSKWNMDTLVVEEKKSETPIAPDTDLYDSLNLFSQPQEEWYRTEITVLETGSDKPNVFIRGCSFIGQSLNVLIKQGIFDKDVHFENYYYYADDYTQTATLSNSQAYDEFDMDRYMGQTDIVILEVNDAGISGMGMGLIEYLLEHPEYTDNQY